MKKTIMSMSVMYKTPEVVLLEHVTENLLCLSNGVELDQLDEVEETW